MDVHDLTAAYAVDALGPEERERYEAHLAVCEQCRELLGELAPAASALAYAVPTPPPPPGLRARILEAAAADNVVPLGSRRRWPVAVAVAAASVAAALGVWAISLHNSLSDVRAQRDAAAQAARILGDPQTATRPLRGANGLVAVDGSGHGVIVFRALAPAPRGKTYEAWVIAPGAPPRPAGTFAGGGATTVVPLSAGVPRGATVAATVERAGGVRHSSARPFAIAAT